MDWLSPGSFAFSNIDVYEVTFSDLEKYLV